MSELNLSITEQLAYSTVRIQCQLSNGKTSTGTGYFYNFCMDEKTKRHIPAIVTNKHVVENSIKGGFVLSVQEEGKVKEKELLPININNFLDLWIPHPNGDIDLCVFPIAPLLNEVKKQAKTPFYISIGSELLPTEEELSELTAMEDVVMIGYPNGIWDSVNNQPVFRRGITATHPAKDYESKPEFLIDAACFPGSSGSPVFLLNLGGYQTRKGAVIGPSRIKLLGTLYAGPQFTATGDIVVTNIPTTNKAISITNIPNNLGFVIKSRILEDFDKILSQQI